MKIKILIVDDEEPCRILIGEYISRLIQETQGAVEMEYAFANTFQAAGESISEVDPAVILLDLGLPNGRDEVIRRIPELSAAAVVILTGTENPRLIIAAFKAGADSFLSKARMTPQSLSDVIWQAWLRREARAGRL